MKLIKIRKLLKQIAGGLNANLYAKGPRMRYSM